MKRTGYGVLSGVIALTLAALQLPGSVSVQPGEWVQDAIKVSGTVLKNAQIDQRCGS